MHARLLAVATLLAGAPRPSTRFHPMMMCIEPNAHVRCRRSAAQNNQPRFY
jgi:hypothetical protein